MLLKKRAYIGCKIATVESSKGRRANEPSNETAQRHSQNAACTASTRAMENDEQHNSYQIRNAPLTASVHANLSQSQCIIFHTNYATAAAQASKNEEECTIYYSFFLICIFINYKSLYTHIF